MVFTKFFEESAKTRNLRSTPAEQTTNWRKSRFNHSQKFVDGNDATFGRSLTESSFGKRKSHSRPSLSHEESPTMKKMRPSKMSKRSQPSAEALALSQKLKELSRQKKLDVALKLFWDKSNDSIRDGHHACIVVDCCSRCGQVSEGEKIVQHMQNSGVHVNVETKTALLKGYAHSGQMAKADTLFESMCFSRSKIDLPNVRTLNTLLRGCLWSAASVDEHGRVAGGVVTAEKAWSLCKKLEEKHKRCVFFDISSYEYSISLLCQALRIEDVNSRIREMRSVFHITDDSSFVKTALSQCVSESLGLSYLSLARAHAALDQRQEAISACQTSLKCIKASKMALQAGSDGSKTHGKCAWKQGNEDNRRAASNAIFRGHRLSEFEMEALAINDILRDTDPSSTSPRQLARRLLTRLVVVSGGGTTDAKDIADDDLNKKKKMLAGDNRKDETSKVVQCRLINTAYLSYGLGVVLKNMDLEFGSTFLKRRECNRLLGYLGLQGGIVLSEGVIDFPRIFSAKIGDKKVKKRRGKKDHRPLEMELGSGFGDWIVKKARETPSTDFLSVELRADRVGQTLSRTALMAGYSPVDNLCMIGAESGSFLSDHIQKGTISKIYINHPEPPTQTFGAESANLRSVMIGELEPAHMLCSRTIKAAANCLSILQESRLIIVTDNKWYGRLICATIVRLMRESPGLLYPVDLTKLNPEIKMVEQFPDPSDDVNGKATISLYEGQPDKNIGYPDVNNALKSLKGASYFDRLWRSGGGTHADKSKRFIIVAARDKE